MGGIGSGLWQRSDRKRTVETCLQLDIWEFIRTGNLVDGKSGVANWLRPGSNRPRQSVSFEFMANHSGSLFLDLRFLLAGLDEVHQRIPISVVRLKDGRLVRRFECPLITDGRRCGRSVRKLYTNARFFGCRHCLNLTYLSCQDAQDNGDTHVCSMARANIEFESLIFRHPWHGWV
jgi:hypothetical protein